MQDNEKQLATMFNAGYQMEKHDPKLLSSVLKSASGDSDYVQALSGGKKQRQKEGLVQQQKQIKDKPNQQIKPK